jgi:antibiotic biosynthesis monooxygenase (ABM) superfamily enzyme
MNTTIDNNQEKVLELVIFSLTEGVTHDEFLSTVEPVSDWVRTQPGFISRDLTYSPDANQYVEVVWWQSLAEAHAAAEAAMSSDSCLPMFSKIQLDSATMLHGEPAIEQVAA